MGLNFKMEYFAIFSQTMQLSFDLINVSHKKQKERRTKITLKARKLTFAYIAISLFIFLVASVGSKRGRKQTCMRAFQAPISGYFHQIISHKTCADKMPLCWAEEVDIYLYIAIELVVHHKLSWALVPC